MSLPGHVSIPLWLDHSGLPELLSQSGKSPQNWLLFKSLVQIDCERNRLPAVFECSLKDLSARTTLPVSKLQASINKLRKFGVIRCFVPDNEEEDCLIQIIVPLQTPIEYMTLQSENPLYREWPPHAFRYAIETEGEGGAVIEDGANQTKFQQVLDLYLNLVSSKMNSFIQDELILISETYDQKMIQKVFSLARQKEITNLGWVIKEIYREKKARKKLSSEGKGFEETQQGGLDDGLYD